VNESRVLTQPRVSVIVPCRRERQWIGACLDSILAGEYPLDRLEVLVVDGLSDDGTRDVIQSYTERFACVRLVDNTALTAPAALNAGIAAATGEIIVRMDAHSVYPADYIARLVHWLEQSGADNVGGVCLTTPINDTALAKAVAAALSHPFGVGNSYFRIGSREPRWVDTVPFGCYRRSVFDRVGLFDAELVRNQDDEFNARLRQAGGRILLVPDITCRYMARGSLGKLLTMQLQYGYYKPLAAAKVGKPYTVRQLVPPAFVVALAGLAVLSMITPLARVPLLFLAAIYAAGTIASAMTVRDRLGVMGRLWLCLAFPTIHFGYGAGYLAGIAALWRRGRANHRTPASGVIPVTR
jgi:glycosyltransferase involved in cell wall biosynthesis